MVGEGWERHGQVKDWERSEKNWKVLERQGRIGKGLDETGREGRREEDEAARAQRE